MDITFKEFQSQVIKDVENVLSGFDFKYLKSKCSFEKINTNGKIVIGLDFLNYYPVSCDYHLSLILWLKPLEHLIQEYYEFIKVKEASKWNAVFFEGDFIPELKNKELKFRSMYYNSVSSQKDLEKSLNDSLQILKTEMLPLSKELIDIENFSEYVLNNQQLIINNFASNEFFISSLFAAYLKEFRSFKEIFSQLQNKLNEFKLMNNDYPELFFHLNSISKFIDYKSTTD